jgi:hypothetical protein
MKSYKIASIPGDGIGPEVIAAGVEVLHAVERLVVLVGQKKAVAIAVRNTSGRRRWSKLAEMAESGCLEALGDCLMPAPRCSLLRMPVGALAPCLAVALLAGPVPFR